MTARAILLGAVMLLGSAGGVAAQAPPEPVGELRWLAPSGAVTALSETPRRRIEAEVRGGALSLLGTLGELAFRSPRILGGEARLAGLSCQTCHPNGGANPHFFVPALSDRPGNVDVSHRRFNRLADDGRDNPLNIPSLRGIARTPPYGRDGRIASLREFTRSVIVTEFDGDEPPGWLLDALIAYQQELTFLPGAPLGPDGRLTPDADAAARRGERLFRQPFAEQPELSCATCHPPTAGFLDGRRHDVGTGGTFDTPTLLNLVETPPYFHDGRHVALDAVVAHFDAVYQLGLSVEARRDLVAYLRAVGAAPDAVAPRRLAGDLQRIGRFLTVVEYAASAEDARIGAFAAESLRAELGRIYERLPHEAGRGLRGQLVELSKGLRRLVHLFEYGAFISAREQLPSLRATVPGWRDVDRLAAGSLYDPAVLQQAVGDR